MPGGDAMDTAKVFMNGRSQAVRLPKEYRFDDEEVYINRVGNIIMLVPKDDPWVGLKESTGNMSGDFMIDREQMPDKERAEL